MAFHLLFERNDLRRSQTPLVDFGSSREAASNAASGINISLSGKEYRSAIGHPNCNSPQPKHVEPERTVARSKRKYGCNAAGRTDGEPLVGQNCFLA
jgi:hypothetical protein